MPDLFLEPGRREEWRDRIRAGDPTAMAILRVLRASAATADAPVPPDAARGADPFEDVLNRLCLAWLEADARAAAAARERLGALMDQPPGSDLGKGAHTLAAVLALEFGAPLWDEPARRAFAGRIAALARSFLEVDRRGNPHHVVNNWWMITHGACLLACIAVDGAEGPDGPLDLGDLKQWALGRCKAFCAHFGDAGLYHEGGGYTAYTLSMLLPALLAVQRRLEPGILDEFPQLRLSVPSLLVGTAAIRHTDNGADRPMFGAALQWNDAGRGCLGLNPFVPGMALAPPRWRGALRAVFDRLLGVEGRNEWRCPYRGLPLTVALYPFSTTPEDPGPVLPRRVWDRRQGLGLWRSAWGRGEESVFGWYARSVHPGGHGHDDAASIRLIALGRTWICGGGQARDRAEWQSVFTHADPAGRPVPRPLAHVTSCLMRDAGGVVGIDTRASLAAYSERHAAWRADLGPPFCLALLDLLDEHRDPPRDWQWTLAFPRELEAVPHADGAGFTLRDPERGELTARFLADRPDRIEVLAMPDSARTYAGGDRVVYPGDRYIRAAYPARRRATVLVALAVAPGPVELDRAGETIRVGGRAWERPFFPSVLPSVRLGASRPNLMLQPAG